MDMENNGFFDVEDNGFINVEDNGEEQVSRKGGRRAPVSGGSDVPSGDGQQEYNEYEDDSSDEERKIHETELLKGINREKYKITCPFCFHEFYHSDVSFRSSNCFETDTEIDNYIHGHNGINRELVKSYKSMNDRRYTEFWKDHGGNTSEIAPQRSNNATKANVNPWNYPVLNHSQITQLQTDSDGFVTHCTDKLFGSDDEAKYERVCPYCHNPLPGTYGKYPVKMISIIGTTGSGKTVYLSQLLKRIQGFAANLGLSATPASTHEHDFITKNRIEKGVKLPESTTPEQLSQPLFFDLANRDKYGNVKKDTIVLFDIAGENCREAARMKKWADYVKHSDGIIVLIDPAQLNFGNANSDVNENGSHDVDEPTKVVTTMHGVFEDREGVRCEIPVAVCISKSDIFTTLLPQAADDVQIAGKTEDGRPAPLFDGQSYNVLQENLKGLMDQNAHELGMQLTTNYVMFNYFAVSAIGCGVENKSPIDTPSPKRMEEPIFWLFKHFGYIGTNSFVKMPYRVTKKVFVEEKEGKIFKKTVIKEKDVPCDYEEQFLDDNYKG